MSTRRTSSLVAAVLVTAAAGLVGALGGAPAHADEPCSSVGVTVVVDFNQLGGGVPTVCVRDGAGEPASTLFETAGQPLTQPTRQPGFVCRVAGKPANDPCVNTSPDTAYWGLWWSDGEPGSTWTYSTKGAYSLKGLAGGLVAFAWDQVEGDERPSASASRPSAPAPSPTSSPTPAPTPGGSPGGSGQGGSGGSGGSSGQGTASPSPTIPSTQPSTGNPSASGSASPSDAPSEAVDEETTPEQKKAKKQRRSETTDAAEPSEDASPEVDEAEEAEVPEVTTTDPALAAETTPVDEGGLPAVVGPVLVVLIFGGAGLAWWLRRRGAASL